MDNRLTRRQFAGGTAAAAFGIAAGWHTPAIVRGSAGAAWGDLTGRFAFDGKAPVREELKVDKDVECCGKFEIRDETYMVGEDSGLANVFIYVRSRGVDICPELEIEPQVKLDNRDCIFATHCMSVWYEKQEFYIVNSDPVAQNIAMTPLGDLPVNKVIPVDGDYTHKFRRKQIVPIKILCNYHPWELAFVLPSENPYVGISAADGTFTIPKLPVGEIEFQVWHEAPGYLNTPDWTRGRFTMNIESGTNDLGTIKLDPAWLPKK